jgi:hypothetical protein
LNRESLFKSIEIGKAKAKAKAKAVRALLLKVELGEILNFRLKFFYLINLL